MRVSLNWVKKYVDLPDKITNKELSYLQECFSKFNTAIP